MASLFYIPQKKTTTLSTVGGISAADQTTGIKVASVTGVDITKPGVLCLNWSDPINESTYEYITYTSIDGTNELQGVTRGAENSTARASHAQGCTVAWPVSASNINNINDKLTGVDAALAVDVHGNEVIKTAHNDSAVNEVTVTNAATGNAPLLSATGGDTNVGLDLKMKGTGVLRKPTIVEIMVCDPAVDTTTGDGKAFFRIPAELNGMNLTGVAASVYTAGTTNTTDVQLRNKTDSVDMLSTKLTIDSGETDTSTAAAAAVIDTTKDDVATGDIIAIDVDQTSTTAAKGLLVQLKFELP